jgi:hypothetical protein
VALALASTSFRLFLLAGFLVFFVTVCRHKAEPRTPPATRVPEMWMRLVIASTFAFLASLLLNFGGAVYGCLA